MPHDAEPFLDHGAFYCPHVDLEGLLALTMSKVDRDPSPPVTMEETEGGHTVCLSTHEMNSPMLEREIVNLEARVRDYQESGQAPNLVRTYTGRIEALQKLLKERADNGTYNDDFEAAAHKARQDAWDAQEAW